MKGSVLVVGSGPAGMRASSELLQQGFKVYLVEDRPTIGGKMAQIDKMFPTNECATCTALPRMLELTSNPNLVPLAFAEVVSVEGPPGDMKARILKRPRYVDPMKCTACTDCFPVCPVGDVPMEFNLGRGTSKAISFYSPFPPRKALINPERCSYIEKGKCGDKETPPCVEACKADAIDFSQKPTHLVAEVGAVILATGIDETRDDALLGRYGYRKIPNVLTALEFERLLSGLGPTGGVVKRDDGKEPGSLAWLVLDDSSPTGLMTAAAEALGSIEKNPQAAASVFYKNIPPASDLYTDFHRRSMEGGVKFIQADPVSVVDDGAGAIGVACTTGGAGMDLKVEMLVLVPPLAPPRGARELLERLGIDTDERGFVERVAGEAHPAHTSRAGFYVCGGAGGAGGIGESVIEACAASANSAALLITARGTELVPIPKIDPLPVSPVDEPAIAAVICRCGMNIAGLLHMDDLVSYTASLPHVKHVEVTPFGCDGVTVKKLLATREFNRIVMGACSPKTHEALFEQYIWSGGLNRHLVEIVNLRNHCTWVHSKDKGAATTKAKTLMWMGVSRAALLEPLTDIHVRITPSCLVIGCTPSGIAGALMLTRMGLEVHVADSEPEPGKMGEILREPVKSMFDELTNHEKVEIHAGVKIKAVEGFIGNYRVEVVGNDGNRMLDVGSLLIATGKGMGLSADGSGYEAGLALTRNEKGFFTPMLGILNMLDSNTDGVFLCGSARADLGVPDSIADGEAAASRIACILLQTQMVKSPRVSFVVDDNCDGCAYCVDPCPARAITLIEYLWENNTKKTVEVNEAICRGCGICMATCPKRGIYVRHFKPGQFEAMINSFQEVA